MGDRLWQIYCIFQHFQPRDQGAVADFNLQNANNAGKCMAEKISVNDWTIENKNI